MQNRKIEELLGKIPKFTKEENYWVVSSGKQKDLYDYFSENSLIGFAYDKVLIQDVLGESLVRIKKIVEDKYSYLSKTYDSQKGFKQAVTIISKEIHSFVNEMKTGDIILLKDRSKEKRMFGKIIEEEATEATKEQLDHLFIDSRRGSCNKIRRVEWLKSIEKEIVSAEINNAMNVSQGLFKINDEAAISHINKSIYSLFSRGDHIHAVFNISSQNDIHFDDYYNLIDLIKKYKNGNINRTEDFFIKTSVESPGPVEIIAAGKAIFKIINSLKSDHSYSETKRILEIKDPGEEEGFDFDN